jgi:hypothetical protein
MYKGGALSKTQSSIHSSRRVIHRHSTSVNHHVRDNHDAARRGIENIITDTVVVIAGPGSESIDGKTRETRRQK